MEEFEYILFSDKVKQMYAADRQLAVLYSAFAFMAIVVSCLGLFGISLFDIRQRYREIAIRRYMELVCRIFTVCCSGNIC